MRPNGFAGLAMPSPDKADIPAGKKKQVNLALSYGEPNFRWQMVFNAFEIERLEHGILLRVAFVYSRSGSDRMAAEIVPFLISHEGLDQLRQSAKQYITQFKNTTPIDEQPLPAARQFSPLFANHVRLSRTGECAEIVLYTVPIMAIASAARGQGVTGAVNCVQVGLLHSDTEVHERLVLNLLS